MDKKPQEKVVLSKKFAFGDILGEGAFATVVKVTDNETGLPFAMKIIDKKRCRGHEAHIISEISILKKVKHENIVNLYDVFETKDKLYLQMEFVDGGELFDRIVNEGFYSEERARVLVHGILNAIDYLHSQQIVHRDLKPENLLMSSKRSDATIKVADFGLANYIKDANTLLTTSCGTLTYAAPEVLRGKAYGQQVDMWSVGVITYILLSGYPPFAGNNEVEVLETAMAAKFEYFSPEWDQISSEAKDFISNLILIDPTKRLTSSQALNHKWIQSIAAKVSTEAEAKFNASVKENLVKNFNAKRKFKATAEAVLVMKRLNSKVKSFSS